MRAISVCGIAANQPRVTSVTMWVEPERDRSGYRRYNAQAVVDLIRIKTLADAGVPLTRIRELLRAGPAEFAAEFGRRGHWWAAISTRARSSGSIPGSQQATVSASWWFSAAMMSCRFPVTTHAPRNIRNVRAMATRTWGCPAA